MSLHSVGIVVALAAEARSLTRQQAPPRQLLPLEAGCGLWLSGMGPQAAQQAARSLVEAGATALAVFGVAGALMAHMRSGSLVCPLHVVDADGHDYPTDPAWQARLSRQLRATTLPVMEGSLLSLRAPLLSATDKAAMHDRYAAAAVDMESAATASVASECGLPFMSLRAIVDERDDAIPAELQSGIDAWGRPRPLGLLAALVRRPSLLVDLPRLARRMSQATHALRTVVAATGPGLGY